MEKSNKRIEFFEILEAAIKKDDLEELDNILSDYYQEFQDSIEQTKELKERYPQFPQTLEYLYDAACDFERSLEEHINAESNQEINISILELKLLEFAEKGDPNFIAEYLKFMDDYDLSDNAIEKLNKNNKIIIQLFIEEINKLTGIRCKNKESGNSINHLLTGIGKIKCEESVNFLNNLLNDYMKEINKYRYDDERMKYINFDFFHILDCMVKQQDKKSIPHILKAKDFFPEEYTDYIICQIAAGRIEKSRDEGYLPMEALEISHPSGNIFKMLSGGEIEYEDNFEKLYGEYFDDDQIKRYNQI